MTSHDDPDVRLDTATLRVLAHPVRINVLTLLRQRGPATASRVAEELGIRPGAASYHLRKLADGGLIAEDPDRGTGRDRWWRALHRQSLHDPAAATEPRRDAGRGYTHAVALASSDRLRRAAAEVPLLPQPWLEASTYADFLLRLSPRDLAGLRDEIFTVIGRYRDERTDADAEPVAVQVQAFPVPGGPPPAGRE